MALGNNLGTLGEQPKGVGKTKKEESTKAEKCFLLFCQQLFRIQLSTSNGYIFLVSYSNWVKQTLLESSERKLSDGSSWKGFGAFVWEI